MSNQIDAQGFVDDFISYYLERGFGTLSKRDMEVLIFHLLHRHGYFGSKINFFEASKNLRISETRVRNLFQDVQLRYDQYSPSEARERFIQVIEQRRFELDSNDKYHFQLRDPLLRQYMEEWIDSVNGIYDSSFSSTQVVVSRDVLIDVLELTAPSLTELRKKLPREVDQSILTEKSRRGIIGRFLDKYVDTLAEESAKGTVQGIVALAGAGLRVLMGS